MLENTELRVERSVLTCSTRLLNSDTTLIESVVVEAVEEADAVSTGAATAAAAGAAGAAATGAATTGAAAATAVVGVVVEEATLRPFLDAAGAVVAEVEVDILYCDPRNFFRETNAGMLINQLETRLVIFLLREREKAAVFGAFDFFQMAFEPKE